VRPPHPKSLRQHGIPGRLCRQLLATLAAPSGDDRPAGTGAHPQAEAVRLRTPAVVPVAKPLGPRKAPSMSGGTDGRGPALLARRTPWRPLGRLYVTGGPPLRATCPAVIAKHSP